VPATDRLEDDVPSSVATLCVLELCDLQLLLFELGPLLLDLLMCDGLSECEPILYGESEGQSVENVMLFWIDVRTKFVKA
jgi:hypothetical protein